MSDVIERIDSVIAGLCACGCGETLTEDSPSAWYASEACYERAHGRAPVEWADVAAWVAEHNPEVQFTDWQEHLGQVTFRMTAFFDDVRAALRPTFRRLSEAMEHLRGLDELWSAVKANEAWEAREERRNRKPRPSRTTKRSRWR